MATISHTSLANLTPKLQNRAVKMALKKGFTQDEAQRMLAVRNNQGEIIDVAMNFSPF